MTDSEALAKARKLWGKDAAVEHNPKSKFGTHSVGVILRIPIFGGAFDVYGWADSWDEAFAKAEKQYKSTISYNRKSK